MADDTLLVVQDPDDPSRGTLRAAETVYRCALGRAGVVRVEAKREGDGATPAGRYRLREVYYRDDRLSLPPTGLPVQTLTEADGWCDDPADDAYNRPVRLPHGSGTEALWRADGRYDVVVPLGYNDDPVVPGHGSAIFLHVAADDYAPTAGCVALALGDLLAVLEGVDSGSFIEICAA